MKIPIHAILIATLLAGSPATGVAETCLDRAAAEIPSSRVVTVIRRDDAVVTGYLASIDTTRQSLTLFPAQGFAQAPTSQPLSEIRTITFKKIKVRPALVVAGFAAGLFIGRRIADSSQRDHALSQTEDLLAAYGEALGYAIEEAMSDAVTMLVGGLVGAVVGAVVSATIPENRTLTCEAQP